MGQQGGTGDWKLIEQALGEAGSIQPGDVYKVSLPRNDLKVTVAGVELRAALALGSWVAFKKAGAMIMVSLCDLCRQKLKFWTLLVNL